MSFRHKTIKTKKRSISSQVTIWYSTFFILLSILLLASIYLISNHYITQSARSRLEAAVIDSIEDFEKNDFQANDEGIYLSRYNNVGQLIEGAVPIPLPSRFGHNQLEDVEIDDVHYLYFDYYDQNHKLWFRGILSVYQNDLIVNNLFWIMTVSLPIVLVFILGGGYLIVRRALLPIKTMSQTAQAIEENLDLSRRIPQIESKSELHQLAQS